MTNCFRFAPRDSVPGLIAKICKYLKDHPGWSEEELEEQIKQFIGQTVVASFNGRTGEVVLNKDDVNNLKIASAYFAEGDESINDLNLKDLYNHGVRFVFTNWNSIISGYDLAFVLDYFSGSDRVVYYPITTGSGGGNVLSVNGKTGIVELSISDILGDSGAQVKLCTVTEFASTALSTWNDYYEEGYRIVGVVNSDATAIDHIYLLKQDENNHQPIGLSVGASDAYTPTNPPPYPVTSVNGEVGSVSVKKLIGVSGGESYITRAPEFAPHLITSEDNISSLIRINTANKKAQLRLQIGDEIFHDNIYSEKSNPPPYPVTSVNGKKGAVTGVYDSSNPPPYPVTSVFGLRGSITPKATMGIIEADVGTLNIQFPQLSIVSMADETGQLPVGNTITRFIIFEKPISSWQYFLVIPRRPEITIGSNVYGKTSAGNGYLRIMIRNVADGPAFLSYAMSVVNFSGEDNKIIGYTRYIP